jgi:YHS domain-containing protein
MIRHMSAAAIILGLTSMSVRADDAATSKDLFVKTVWPTMEAKCFKCHGEKKQKGEMRLDQKAAAFKGGESEKPAIVPGDLKKSQMSLRINLAEDHDDAMPPKKPFLTKAEKEAFDKWIQTGAVWVEVKKSAAAGEKKEKVARKVAPADPATLKALQDVGALAGPLAQNTNIVGVNFMRVSKDINDKHLPQLKKIATQLEWLNLADTKITDAGLANLKDLKHLTRLHLEKTGVGDAGLAHLEGLAYLEYLNLYGTKVTDKGLASIAKLPNLKKVYLWQTQVTDKAADAFRKSHAKLMVDNGWKAPPKPPAVISKTVNVKCPLTGKPVVAGHTFKYKNEEIGFCCPNCLGKFKGKPAGFIGKVVRVNKPAVKAKAGAKVKVGATATVKVGAKVKVATKTFNSKCPLSGKAVNPAHTLAHKGKTVGFCCPNCLAKFKKEPDKFFAKVKP